MRLVVVDMFIINYFVSNDFEIHFTTSAENREIIDKIKT